jgi:hypothetical protein
MRLPTLDSLTIAETNYRYTIQTGSVILLNAPKLIKLRLNLVQPQNILHEDNLKNITKLVVDLNTYQLSDYYKILKQSLQLIDCKIRISCSTSDIGFDELEGFSLPHLTTLSIVMHKKITTLLSKINTPVLSTFHISKNNPKIKLRVTSLAPFIHKTPTILQINVTGYRVTQDQKEFDYNINITHPKTIINWTNIPEINHIKYFQDNESGSNTEDDISQYTSGPEESILQNASGPEESIPDSTVNSDTDY